MALGPETGKYTDKLLPILLRELRCEDSGNRRNAAFCVGVFCQFAPQQMQSHIMQVLQVSQTFLRSQKLLQSKDSASA